MGPAHGTKATDEAQGMGLNTSSVLEWDVGSDLLLATFTGDAVSNLQAYDQTVGPAGAADLSCAAFRH
jgi:hypothetical protein